MLIPHIDNIYLVYTIDSICPFCAINILYMRWGGYIYASLGGCCRLPTNLPACLPVCLPVSVSDSIRGRGWPDRRLSLPASFWCPNNEDVRKERWVKNKVGYIGGIFGRGTCRGYGYVYDQLPYTHLISLNYYQLYIVI